MSGVWRTKRSDIEQRYTGTENIFRHLQKTLRDRRSGSGRRQAPAAHARGTYTIVAGRSKIALILPPSLRKSTSRAVFRVNPGDL